MRHMLIILIVMKLPQDFLNLARLQAAIIRDALLFELLSRSKKMNPI
jgi:hypothetical protein